MDNHTINRSVLIPRRMQGKNLAGMGDLIDEYGNAILQMGDAYNWLASSRRTINSTASLKLNEKWKQLLLSGEELRGRAARIQLEPSIGGFIESFFGASSNIPIIGTIDRFLSSELAVFTADAQKFIAETEQLKLAVDQYERMVKSGISPSEAAMTIDEAQAGLFDKITGALKWPVMGAGLVALIIAAVIFMPEIRAGIRKIKHGRA